MKEHGANMKLVVALGNPDQKYTGTRHNVGRAALNYWLSEINSATLLQSVKAALTGREFNTINVPKFNGKAFKIQTEKSPVVIAPDLGCFMNNSGEPVNKLLQFFKLTPDNLIVIHDEIDLPLGEVRVSTNSSPGGHNGVKSIIQHIGTQNFTRIRLGIENRKETRIPPTNKYVLQLFKQDEEAEVLSLLNKAVNELENLL